MYEENRRCNNFMDQEMASWFLICMVFVRDIRINDASSVLSPNLVQSKWRRCVRFFHYTHYRYLIPSSFSFKLTYKNTKNIDEAFKTNVGVIITRNMLIYPTLQFSNQPFSELKFSILILAFYDTLIDSTINEHPLIF